MPFSTTTAIPNCLFWQYSNLYRFAVCLVARPRWHLLSMFLRLRSIAADLKFFCAFVFLTPCFDGFGKLSADSQTFCVKPLQNRSAFRKKSGAQNAISRAANYKPYKPILIQIGKLPFGEDCEYAVSVAAGQLLKYGLRLLRLAALRLRKAEEVSGLRGIRGV